MTAAKSRDLNLLSLLPIRMPLMNLREDLDDLHRLFSFNFLFTRQEQASISLNEATREKAPL